MIDYKQIIKNREIRLKIIRLLSFIPTKPYLKMVYKIKTGEKLNLENPIGFNEKLNWLKIHNVNNLYTKYVDKIEAKKIVDLKLGEGHTIPTLGVWDSFDEIDFDLLPNEFVLKCNHDSGSVKIIRNKNQIDKKELKKFFAGRLKTNCFCLGREYPYKNVKPKILAEKLIKAFDSGSINDYKFFCFQGVPKIMFVATERDIDCKFNFFDMDFKPLDIENIHPKSDKRIKCPTTFSEMKKIAAELSKGIPFVRIDLYEIDGTVYFSEYTFFHGGGFYLFKPDKWERKLGSYINIKEI